MSASARKTELAEALLAADAPADAHPSREAAKARLLAMGAPSRRDEYWKFTDPSALTAPLPSAPAAATTRGADAFDAVEPLTLVFDAGRLRADLSDPLEEAGLEIAPLMSADWAASALGALEARGQEHAPRPLAAFNGAMATDGVALRATGVVARPVRLQHIAGADGAAYQRTLVQVAPGASLTLIEAGLGVTRLNTVMEAEIGTGGALHHARVQTEERSSDAGQAATHIFAQLAEDAAFKSFSLTRGRGSELARNETVVWLDGPGGSANLAGGAVCEGGATVDNTVFLTHGAERCESRQVFKNVIADDAHGVFQGKILVKQPAQKTDGYQISQSVLLDDRAAFHAKPELEIYADDVICSHGSTTGALDQNMLFYLRARGVSEAAARRLLIIAFLEDAIDEIEADELKDAVRAEAERMITALTSGRER